LTGGSSRKTRGFSLFEVLTVMAIMSLVAGFTLPALKGITGGNGVSAGAAQISNLLTLARSQAIAQHTIVRFAVATEWNGLEGQANLRRASLWAWQPVSSSTATPTSGTSPTPLGFWRPITTWQELPEGVVLEAGLPQYVLNSSYAGQDASTVRGSCVLGDDVHNFGDNAAFSAPTTSGLISTRFIEFLPTGAANIPGSSDRQAIFVATQGYYAGADSQIAYTSQSHGQPTNWAQVNVDTLTGHVHVYRP
jgi:prepilin-type N-terminal cleavage/methylation domain-containing protein